MHRPERHPGRGAVAVLLGVLAGASLLAALPAGIVDLEGREVDPFAGPPDLVRVFVFVRTDCPISNRYAPELRSITRAMADRPVRITAVYLEKDRSPADFAAHLAEFDYGLDAIWDPGHQLVARTGATVTPEAAVFVGDRMVYRGRIDDRYVSFGRSRRAPTRHDLRDAIEAALAGTAIDEPRTQAIGCFIPDLQ